MPFAGGIELNSGGKRPLTYTHAVSLSIIQSDRDTGGWPAHLPCHPEKLPVTLTFFPAQFADSFATVYTVSSELGCVSVACGGRRFGSVAAQATSRQQSNAQKKIKREAISISPPQIWWDSRFFVECENAPAETTLCQTTIGTAFAG